MRLGTTNPRSAGASGVAPAGGVWTEMLAGATLGTAGAQATMAVAPPLTASMRSAARRLIRRLGS